MVICELGGNWYGYWIGVVVDWRGVGTAAEGVGMFTGWLKIGVVPADLTVTGGLRVSMVIFELGVTVVIDRLG